MMGPNQARIGVAHLIAFYLPDSGVSLTCKVIRESDEEAQTVTLSERSALSVPGSRVYTGEYTPALPGWYFIHYLIGGSVPSFGPVTSRFYAEDPAALTGGNPVAATDGSFSAQTVVGGRVGTLTASTGRR